jgi:hypothetical protein
MSSMMLHCGANNVSLDDVLAVTTPEPTETWYPIAYGDFIETVKESLEGVGLGIAREQYGLWDEANRETGEVTTGAMFFGLLTLDQGKDDYALSIGLRASHNQRFANSLVAGSNVFVCDNLCFSGEVRINRKNTKFAYQDLVRMVMESMGKIGEIWTTQEARYEGYKQQYLTDSKVHDILVRAMLAKAIPNSYIKKIVDEWQNPSHEEFWPRTVWSLQNAFTEIYKQANVLDTPARTTRLHGLLDSVVEATEQRNLVDDLLNKRAIYTPAIVDMGLGGLIEHARPAEFEATVPVVADLITA